MAGKMNSHSEGDLNENMFVSPKILVSSIYSESESGPESEDDQDDECQQSEPEKSSVEDSSDDSSETESSTKKKMKLSKSPKKLLGTIRPLSTGSAPIKRTVYKEKSKSAGHTPSRPSTEIIHSKRKLKGLGHSKHSTVDDLGKISNLLGEVLKRLERTEAKLESVEHKLESSSLSSSSCSEKKREVPQIVKVNVT